MKFSDFYLMEKLVTFGGKANPRFNQVVILGGGAGGGKGFVKNNLLGIEGKTFDVDELKLLAKASETARKKFPELDKLNLRTPEDVERLHAIVKELGYKNKRMEAFAKSVLSASPDRKPNLIFDVTLSSASDLNEISGYIKSMGYEPIDTHLIWVVNDIEVARKQNAKRDRVVPEHILLATHKGAAKTMKEILGGSIDLHGKVDGDAYIVFNKASVDTQIVTKGDKKKSPFFIKNAFVVPIKKKGKATISFDDFKMRFYDALQKIQSYIPGF